MKKKAGILESIITMLTNVRFLMVVFGYAAFTFVLGALTFWATEYVVMNLDLPLTIASAAIGGVTIFTGFIGTGTGGFILDKLGGAISDMSAAKALRLSAIAIILATPIGYMAFVFFSPISFFVCVTIAQLLMFTTVSPINSSILTIAPKELRAMAMALTIFIIHAIGDFPSPIIVGVFTDITGSEQFSMLFLATWLGFCAAFLFIGSQVCLVYAEKLAEAEHQPLFEGKTRNSKTS